jgi:hypothetical protein
MQPVLELDGVNNELVYISKELMRLSGHREVLKVSASNSTKLILSESLIISENELWCLFDILNLEREENLPKDIHSRFDQNYLKWDVNSPYVSKVVDNIRRCIPTSSNQKFSVIITHDIDWVTGFEFISAIKAFKNYFGRGKWLSFTEVLNADVFIDNYKSMIEVEKKYNVSTWNFVLADTYGLKRYSTRYGTNWKSFHKILECICDSNNNIGLHGSYYACQKNSYKAEADLLRKVSGKEIIAHRNHYLRFHPSKIWDQLEGSGIKYDFSVGYSDIMGFRAGTAMPYYPYNKINSSASCVKEVPLIFMEREKYLLDIEKSLESLKELLENVKKYDGCVSILFHPESFVVNKQWIEFYERVLMMIVEMGADVSGTLPVD